MKKPWHAGDVAHIIAAEKRFLPAKIQILEMRILCVNNELGRASLEWFDGTEIFIPLEKLFRTKKAAERTLFDLYDENMRLLHIGADKRRKGTKK